MQKTIEILTVNPPKTGVTKAGKPWTMVDCECIVNNPDNTRSVGVLLLGRKIDATKVIPGVYVGTFDIVVDYKTRKIGAEIVDLQLAQPARSVPPAQAAKVA